MIRLSLAASAAVVIAFAAIASAQPQPRHGGWNGGWRVIAHKVVNRGTDTDSIYLPGRQRYSQLRLCAFGGPVRMRDFDVYFANGGRQDVRTRDVLGPGTCTRAIALNGRGRDITRIRLKYEKIDRSMRLPTIQVSAR